MTKNDRNLLRQMIQANRFSYGVYELLCKANDYQAKQTIKKMGSKWCCHSDNKINRLDKPIEILKSNNSKILIKKA